MRYIATICFILATLLGSLVIRAYAQPAVPTYVPTPAAETTVVIEKITPDQVEILIWKWAGIMGTAITAVTGIILLALAKVKEIKERLNRKEERDNLLHSEVVKHLHECTPPSLRLPNPPNPPNPPNAPNLPNPPTGGTAP